MEDVGREDGVAEKDGSEPVEPGRGRLAEPGERLHVALACDQIQHVCRERPTEGSVLSYPVDVCEASCPYGQLYDGRVRSRKERVSSDK